jgi:Flp pilus assembly protein TadG
MRIFPMTWRRNPLAACRTASARWLFFRRDDAGAAAVLFALAAPLLIGAMGLAAEVSYWRVHQRGMQNAADAAAIAAATNGGSTYVAEAQAVAAQYGFQNGAGNIAVTVSTTSGCVAADSTIKCYTVQISDKVPVLLTSVVGFRGNTTIVSSTSSGVSQISTTAAMSMQGSSTAASMNAYKYCIVALGTSGVTDITSNGAQKADLGGCNIASNAGATCNGGNLNAGIVDAHGAIKGCGTTQNANLPPPSLTDIYAPLASSIPADTCSSYPQEPSLSGSNQWPRNRVSPYDINDMNGGFLVVCGDQQLTADITIRNGVLVIENGRLDTNGHTLTGTSLTIVFSGSNNVSYQGSTFAPQHVPSGSGALNIAAPTSGTWHGVAIYQDPALTTNVDISSAGNSPRWNITGLVYLPHASVTLSGSAGASTSGAKCFMLVVDHLTINGTGSVFAGNTECEKAGLTQMGGGSRGTLVD